jgi:fatty-acyl-CoA synthase
MMHCMLTFTEIRERIATAPARLRVTARVARTSGMIWNWKAAGLKAAARMLLKERQSPSAVFRLHAANSPDRVGLVWRDQKLTFREIDERLDRIAAALARRGLSRGQSVVVMMRNRAEFLLLQSAVARAGGAAVSVSWRSTPSELVYLAGHCGARFIAFEHDLHSVVEQALEQLDVPKNRLVCVGGKIEGTLAFDDLVHEQGEKVEEADDEDAAVVVYTSGTTGKPKGAVRKFPKDTFVAAMRFISETPMRHDDVHLAACPLYHSTAFGFSALTFLLGGTVAVLDEFKAEHFLEAVERWNVTTTAVVPTMLHRILSIDPAVLSKYKTRSLRIVFCGGAPLPGPLAIAFMDRFGDILYNFYGATETGLVTLATPADLRAAPGTIGRAIEGNEIRLLDDQGRDVPTGAVGELYVKNDLLVAGYHKDEAATRESMRDGFFSVGDLARRDGAGRYFIEGRKRDMIISGGVNVYPAEVEGVLEQHPDIAEVAVVGLPDPEWGERVTAFVVRRRGSHVDEGALRAWTRERLAGPKVPREFRFLEALPRNPTGKVLKRELRA